MLDEAALRRVMAAVLEVNIGQVTSEASMDTISSWDSLHHMNLVLALEEEFKISIPDEDAASITSYRLIKLVMEEQLAARR